MPTRSAGILLFRLREPGLEVLIGHPGGPFYTRKDASVWSIPKGEYTDEEPWNAAVREFTEEVRLDLPCGTPIPLGEVTQSNRKIVTAFALEGDIDTQLAQSNTFEMEWPPRSGKVRSFPEVDKLRWFDIDTARPKLVTAQRIFLDRLVGHLFPPPAATTAPPESPP